MLKGISKETMDFDYAVQSLREEVEAVTDYLQRAEVVTDLELKEILTHHAKEEMEHAAMLVEWMRRNNMDFGSEIAEYIFAKGKIVGVEAAAMGRDSQEESSGNSKEKISINIGSLK